MKHSLLRASALVGASAIALTVGAATPAFAIDVDGRALPEGYSMYAMDCGFNFPGLQLLSIDTPTADVTPIGSGTDLEGTTCSSSGAVDPATGSLYIVGWGEGDQYLGRVDLLTGTTTKVAAITYQDEPAGLAAITIAADGTAYAIGDMDDAEQGLYELDLTDGELTAIGGLDFPLTALAADPETGKLVGLTDIGWAFSVDSATAGQYYMWPLGDLFESPIKTYSLAIDTDGMFWFTTDFPYDFVDGRDRYSQSLWSLDPTDRFNTLMFSGDLSQEIADDDLNRSYVSGVTIAPTAVAPVTPVDEETDEVTVVTPAAEEKKELADTGFDGGAAGWIALAVAALGGALFGVSRMRRSRA